MLQEFRSILILAKYPDIAQVDIFCNGRKKKMTTELFAIILHENDHSSYGLNSEVQPKNILNAQSNHP